MITGVPAAVVLSLARQPPSQKPAPRLKNNTTGTAESSPDACWRGRPIPGSRPRWCGSLTPGRHLNCAGSTHQRSGGTHFDKLRQARLSTSAPCHAGRTTGRFILAESEPRIEVGRGETTIAPDTGCRSGATPFPAASSTNAAETSRGRRGLRDAAVGRRDPPCSESACLFHRTDDHGRFRLFGLSIKGSLWRHPRPRQAYRTVDRRCARRLHDLNISVPSRAQARCITLRRAADLDGIDIQIKKRTRIPDQRTLIVQAAFLGPVGRFRGPPGDERHGHDVVTADQLRQLRHQRRPAGDIQADRRSSLWARLEGPAPSE